MCEVLFANGFLIGAKKNLTNKYFCIEEVKNRSVQVLMTVTLVVLLFLFQFIALYYRSNLIDYFPWLFCLIYYFATKRIATLY